MKYDLNQVWDETHEQLLQDRLMIVTLQAIINTLCTLPYAGNLNEVQDQLHIALKRKENQIDEYVKKVADETPDGS